MLWWLSASHRRAEAPGLDPASGAGLSRRCFLVGCDLNQRCRNQRVSTSPRVCHPGWKSPVPPAALCPRSGWDVMSPEVTQGSEPPPGAGLRGLSWPSHDLIQGCDGVSHQTLPSPRGFRYSGPAHLPLLPREMQAWGEACFRGAPAPRSSTAAASPVPVPAPGKAGTETLSS